MSRVQLALRVPDLEASIAFYSRLFGTEPAKLRDGYANFAIAEPPLKLVLIEGAAGEETRMDHLGVEVASSEAVTAATARLGEAGLATTEENDTTCCYALQDKVWVHGPGKEPWEVYVVKADAGSLAEQQPHDVGTPSADGQPDAHLTPAAAGRVRDQPVGAHAGEQQARNRRNEQQRGKQNGGRRPDERKVRVGKSQCFGYPSAKVIAQANQDYRLSQGDKISRPARSFNLERVFRSCKRLCHLCPSRFFGVVPRKRLLRSRRSLIQFVLQ